MKRFLLSCLTVACAYLLLIGVFDLGAGRWLLERWVNRTQPALHGSFRCDALLLTPDLRVYARGCRARMTDAARTATSRDVRIRQWALRNSLVDVWRRRHLVLEVSEGSLTGRDIRIDGLMLQLDGLLSGAASGMPQPIGRVAIRDIQAGALALHDVTGAILQQSHRYVIDPLAMHIYSGALRGALAVTVAPSTRVELSLTTDRLLLGDLAPLNQEMFRGAAGHCSGAVQVAGDASGLTALDGALRVAAPGGSIGSAVLQALLPYLPPTAERDRLSRAIERHALVPFQSASLTVTIVDPQHIKTVLTMSIPEYNLLVDHATIDIRFDDPKLLSRVLEFLSALRKE